MKKPLNHQWNNENPFSFELTAPSTPTIGFVQRSQLSAGEAENDPHNGLKETILSIAEHYINRRLEQGFADYAAQDMLRMMDKVFVRYFDKIVYPDVVDPLTLVHVPEEKEAKHLFPATVKRNLLSLPVMELVNKVLEERGNYIVAKNFISVINRMDEYRKYARL